MRKVVGAFVMAVVLTACSDDPTARTAPPVPTPEVVQTSTSTSSTTTPAASTTTTARATTTAPAPASPEASARALYAAWAASDRAAAAKVAQPAAVDVLFARRWQAADLWSFSECSGAAGSTICAWRRPSGEQLLIRVQNPTGGVAEVRFQP